MAVGFVFCAGNTDVYNRPVGSERLVKFHECLLTNHNQIQSNCEIG